MASLRERAAANRAQRFADAATASYLKYQWEAPPDPRDQRADIYGSKGILREEYLNRHNFSLDERKKYEFPKGRFNPNVPKQREIYDEAWARILDEDMENRIKGQIAVMRGEIEKVPFSTLPVEAREATLPANLRANPSLSGGKKTRSHKKSKKATRKTWCKSYI